MITNVHKVIYFNLEWCLHWV